MPQWCILDLIRMKNVCPAGRQALGCFLVSFLIFTTSFFSGSALGYTSELWALNYWGPALYFCLLNFILRYCYKGFTYEVSSNVIGLNILLRRLFYNTSCIRGVFLFPNRYLHV